MNVLITSGIKGVMLGIMIISASVLSVDFGGFDNPYNADPCEDTLDFQKWLNQDAEILPNKFDIRFEFENNGRFGTYSQSYVTDQFLGVFPNNTHGMDVLRTGVNSWYQSFNTYSNITFGTNGYVPDRNVILSNYPTKDNATDLVEELKLQLLEIFAQDPEKYTWAQVIDRDLSDNMDRQIRVTLLGNDRSAIQVFFQEKGIMISGVWAQYSLNGDPASQQQIENFSFQGEYSMGWRTAGCVYYHYTDSYEDTLNYRLIDFLHGYIGQQL